MIKGFLNLTVRQKLLYSDRFQSGMRVYSNRGIIIDDNCLKVGLDNNKGDVNFISHAHSDHLFSSKKKVLASRETRLLAAARSRGVGEDYEHDSFEMVDSGHVLGSKALLYHGSKTVLYTGDFCTRNRHFLKGFKPVKADVLIVETTFGRPEYVFPGFRETVKNTKSRVQGLLDDGKNVVMQGYSLGKAQHLCRIAEKLGEEVFVDEAVKKINDVHRSAGVRIKNFPLFNNQKRFVLVSPKRFPGAVNLSFTGWNAARPKSQDSFVLSDHADFFELIKTVKKVDPEKVFTVHGFAENFAAFLRAEGFDASELRDKQHSLNNFF
jgi:putative mRNA 3-end processing factor